MLINNFMLGVNYWPRTKAMYWWKNFNINEVKKDFEQMHKLGFSLIRIFLIWEDFQPGPNKINYLSLKNLKEVLHLGQKYKLKFIITFFTGHMSGINFVPKWALSKEKTKRFYSISKGRVTKFLIKDIFKDPTMLKAQIFQIKKVVSAIHKHKAVFAYDLSNEVDNLRIPDSSKAVNDWVKILSREIKKIDNKHFVTCGGMHVSRGIIKPEDLALSCDFLSVHAYPKIVPKLNSNLAPLKCKISWKRGKKPILLEEFGLPILKDKTKKIKTRTGHRKFDIYLIKDNIAAKYYSEVLKKVHKECKNYCFGVLAWCWTDYSKNLWKKPPLNTAKHERFFGITINNNLKMAGQELEKFALERKKVKINIKSQKL